MAGLAKDTAFAVATTGFDAGAALSLRADFNSSRAAGTDGGIAGARGAGAVVAESCGAPLSRAAVGAGSIGAGGATGVVAGTAATRRGDPQALQNFAVSRFGTWHCGQADVGS